MKFPSTLSISTPRNCPLFSSLAEFPVQDEDQHQLQRNGWNVNQDSTLSVVQCPLFSSLAEFPVQDEDQHQSEEWLEC